MTPAIRSSVLCIIQKSGAPPAQPCCNVGCARIRDQFGSEEGRGGAARARVPSAELSSVSYSTDGFPKGNQAGWESQLLETGFLGIFLCPLWTLSRLPRHTPPSSIVIWGFRWLIFRIMLGAGLIKIRGDRCWRELTCMDYHYETQPVPNPIAYFMHRSPWWFHQFETLVNHFIELVVPFFLFLGRRMCVVHGLLQILFQVLLIVSGNLSFLNWLTIVPSIACFDDSSLGFLFSSRRGGVKERVAEMQLKEAAGEQLPLGCYVRKVVNISFGLLIAYLSIPVVLNLLNSRQVMNTSFNPLRIVNTYGAFGSITKERTEVVLQGTSSLDPNDPAAVWEEYDFKCKPGDLKRRPCFISPYHYRLDWLMWFAAFQVDPRGTLQVQIQPTRGKARQRGEVVDSEEDRPLLPPRQPPGPEEVLRRQELAVPRAGLMEEDEQGQEGPAGEEGEQSAPLQTTCLGSVCIFYPYPCLHIFYRRFPANLSTCCCGLVFLIFLFLSVHPSRHGLA
ncbi:lipase maturation factor 1 isoform X1 [Harpia harpyja]|uniref:lipase maturation factor 1 isoform X1 n=1 Tax=Harpia harpyja TaxID=202280 RepID=UPI0022B1600A|nr:lipase maturation factor 1 isoform X1 [Harpia harpyja]